LQTTKRLLALVFLASALAGCMGKDTASTNGSNPTPSNTGSATLSWTPPTTDTNGNPLTVGGYVVYYGTDSADLTQSVNITDGGTLTTVIDNLAFGTWYFGIAAIGSDGMESTISNVVSKTVGS